jgi:hypothetical protein
VQDLRDGAAFWQAHPSELKVTDVTSKDLARATALADKLEAAAAKEAADSDAATALELRDRCFWAANDLATDRRPSTRRCTGPSRRARTTRGRRPASRRSCRSRATATCRGPTARRAARPRRV